MKMDMRTQTFGVEIEMNHITRKQAATIVAGYFRTNRVEDTAYRNGYKTWSCYDYMGREWKFQRDCSIVGPDEEKCEMVTPILYYKDIKDLQEIVRLLRRAGAVSNPANGCGVHVHVGADGHTPKTLRNLVNIMASHEMLLATALKIDSGRINSYCQPVNFHLVREINRVKPKTMAQLADVWYKSQDCDSGRNDHYNRSRYHMLNLHATFTKGTIEFRLFQFNNPGRNFKGGLHAGQLKAYIQLCLALSNKAKEINGASPNAKPTDNLKYAMRTWLLRLGFIGDEFKTARDILTRNLDGNAAWRNRTAA